MAKFYIALAGPRLLLESIACQSPLAVTSPAPGRTHRPRSRRSSAVMSVISAGRRNLRVMCGNNEAAGRSVQYVLD
jgi:hypothetical protein